MITSIPEAKRFAAQMIVSAKMKTRNLKDKTLFKPPMSQSFEAAELSKFR